MNYKINQTYRIDIETVEKLHDKKVKEGTSINEIVNTLLKLGLETASEIEIDHQELEVDNKVPSILNEDKSPEVNYLKKKETPEVSYPKKKETSSATEYIGDIDF